MLPLGAKKYIYIGYYKQKLAPRGNCLTALVPRGNCLTTLVLRGNCFVTLVPRATIL